MSDRWQSGARQASKAGSSGDAVADINYANQIDRIHACCRANLLEILQTSIIPTLLQRSRGSDAGQLPGRLGSPGASRISGKRDLLKF